MPPPDAAAVSASSLLTSVPEEVRAAAAGALHIGVRGLTRPADVPHEFAPASNTGNEISATHYSKAAYGATDNSAMVYFGAVVINPSSVDGLKTCGVQDVQINLNVNGKSMQVKADKFGRFNFTAVPGSSVYANVTYEDHSFCAVTKEGYCIAGHTTHEVPSIDEKTSFVFYDTTMRQISAKLVPSGCGKQVNFTDYALTFQSVSKCKHRKTVQNGFDGEWPAAMDYVAVIHDAPELLSGDEPDEGYTCSPRAARNMVDYFERSASNERDVKLLEAPQSEGEAASDKDNPEAKEVEKEVDAAEIGRASCRERV